MSVVLFCYDAKTNSKKRLFSFSPPPPHPQELSFSLVSVRSVMMFPREKRVSQGGRKQKKKLIPDSFPHAQNGHVYGVGKLTFSSDGVL